MSELLADTIGNPKWLEDNSHSIAQMFPSSWTPSEQLNLLGVGFKLKLLGVDWRSEEELAMSFAYFERLGLVERKDMTFRANPKFISN